MEAMKEVQKRGVAPEQPHSPKDGSGEGYCPICGREGDPALKRFGQYFCSEAHVADYAAERRAKPELTEPGAAAPDVKSKSSEAPQGVSCAMGTKGGLRKMGWCLAGVVGLLVAIPLIASGGVAATAGSLLSVVAVLACPIGMYFMMRAMMKMPEKKDMHDEGERK